MVRIAHSSFLGNVPAPPSKSMAHRLMIAAALASSPTRLFNVDACGDVAATLSSLCALGAEYTLECDCCTISPSAPKSCGILSCGESASTLRLMLPSVALLCQSAFVGCAKALEKRPHGALLAALGMSGDVFSKPVECHFSGGDILLPGDVSSQYVSGLLFALPKTSSGGRIRLSSRLESRGYVMMTIDVMKRFGVDVTVLGDGFDVPGNQEYVSPGEAVIEGDWSGSANLLALGALGGRVGVSGLSVDSLQPDASIIDVLCAMGANASLDGGVVTVSGNPNGLSPLNIDISQAPDLFCIQSVLCAFAGGTSVLYNGARLRYKECDRLHAMAQCLRRLGVSVHEGDDSLTICGKVDMKRCEIRGFNDHRVVMAMSVALAIGSGGDIFQPKAVDKSFSGFYNKFITLGGICNVL